MKKIVLVLLFLAVLGGVQVVSADVAAPVAMLDDFVYYWGWMDLPPCGNLLENDYDPNGLPLTAELVSGPKCGGVSLGSNGGFCYDPDLYFAGVDIFEYRVYNGYKYSEPALVCIIIGAAGTEHSPSTLGDSYIVSANTPLDVPAPGILANDCIIGSYSYEGISAVLIQDPIHGNLCLNPDGSFTYTPDAGFTGSDSFLYVAANDDDPLFWFSNYTKVTITVSEPTSVPEFPGMYVMICGIVLGTAFIAMRVRIHR